MTINNEFTVFNLNLTVKSTVNSIILQHVGNIIDFKKVVDTYNFYIISF